MRSNVRYPGSWYVYSDSSFYVIIIDWRISHTDLHSCPGSKRAGNVEPPDDWRPRRYPDAPTPLSQVPDARRGLHSSRPSGSDMRTCFDRARRSPWDTSRRSPRTSSLRKYPSARGRGKRKAIRNRSRYSLFALQLTASISLRAFHLSCGAFTSAAVWMVLFSQLVQTLKPCECKIHMVTFAVITRNLGEKSIARRGDTRAKRLYVMHVHLDIKRPAFT